MKLTKKSKEIIDNDSALKVLLCIAFKKSYDTIQRWIRNNTEDGPLTTTKALYIIEKHTSIDKQMLLDTRN